MIPSVLLLALIAVESGGNDSARGPADELGCLQIRLCVAEDCNRIQNMVHFTPESRLNRETSIMMCEIYLSHYAAAGRLGHEPTDEDFARIWNGGPDGWIKLSTLPYWHKVQALLR